MRLSHVLCKHHIGRQIRQLWYIQGKKKPHDIKTEGALLSKGIHVEEAMDVTYSLRKAELNYPKFDFSQLQPLREVEAPLPCQSQPCFSYEDNNLLVLGLPQAQKITKTIVFNNIFPTSVESIVQDVSEETNEVIKRTIQTSAIFDAYQEMLPKIKDPERPAFNFPRQLGITDVRKISNLSKKFIHLCDCLSGPDIANSRIVVNNAFISVPFVKDSEQFKFSLTMDIMLMSENPLRPMEKFNKEHEFMTLPSIHPMHHTIGLSKNENYKLDNLYPVISEYNKKYIHTIFAYYDSTMVKNVTELEVTETQVFARALIKVFTAAASAARQRFGTDVKVLPEPVTVQCIHSDGKAFYFSVYQLNTLDINGEEGIKNYCWVLPKMDLYNTAGYVKGRPILEGYNPEVFKRILSFYKNQ